VVTWAWKRLNYDLKLAPAVNPKFVPPYAIYKEN